MMASPMYLSMVPRFLWMTRVIGVSRAFINCVSCFGSMPSEIVVKPRTSENSTVISRFSPSSENSSGDSDISSTSSGGI